MLPPEATQVGEDSILEGAERSVQLVSLGKPEECPVTTVPIGPLNGLRVRALTGPAIAAKFAVAESPGPPFVWDFTV